MSIPPALGNLLGKLVADQAVQAGAQQLAQNLVGRASQAAKPEAGPPVLTADQLAAALASLATRDQLVAEMQLLRQRQERQDRQGIVVLALLVAVLVLQLVVAAVLILH